MPQINTILKVKYFSNRQQIFVSKCAMKQINLKPLTVPWIQPGGTQRFKEYYGY